MPTSNEGRRRIEQYLAGEITLFALNDWSLEFGDDPVQRADLESMEIAGLVTELVDDWGRGVIDETTIAGKLAESIGVVTGHRQTT